MACGGEMDPLAENDALYQALREHKKKQMSQHSVQLQETLSVMEQLARKKKEADETRSVVTALSNYSNNTRYKEINSGLDRRIKVKHAMHPIGPDECDVFTMMVDSCPSAHITAMPNHCITSVGEVEVRPTFLLLVVGCLHTNM